MKYSKRKNTKNFEKTTEYVGPVIGAIANASIENAVDSPIGVWIGASAEVLITKIFTIFSNEISQRNLSHWESQKIKKVYDSALIKIQENFRNGKQLRDDNFFSEEDNRSSAEEIFEGILLSSQRENEEKS